MLSPRKGGEFCQTRFCISRGVTVWVLSLAVFTCCIMSWFSCVGSSMRSRSKSPQQAQQRLVCKYFIEFCIHIQRGCWSVVLLWYFYLLLLSRLCWPQEELGSVPSSLDFWQSARRVSFTSVGQISLLKPSSPGLAFLNDGSCFSHFRLTGKLQG